MDIIEVVGRHVQIKKSGRNYMGLCPFHKERSPSFVVNEKEQTYHCFSCGAHGTASDFIANIDPKE
jgi:DNA primase